MMTALEIMAKKRGLFAPLGEEEIESLKGHDLILYMRTMATVAHEMKAERVFNGGAVK